jgi:hypothetical protein
MIFAYNRGPATPKCSPKAIKEISHNPSECMIKFSAQECDVVNVSVSLLGLAAGPSSV